MFESTYFLTSLITLNNFIPFSNMIGEKLLIVSSISNVIKQSNKTGSLKNDDSMSTRRH